MTLGDPLFSTVILLGSGVVGLGAARFVHISPIVGLFILGALIGPDAFGLIERHTPTIHLLGELGVCFLLFDIGLHLSLTELRRGWRQFFLAGSLQTIFATAALAVVGNLFGLTWPAAISLGAILSLSSTALVLKILSDEREESSPVGKRATEILVFQDIVAIILLVLLSGDMSKGITLSAVTTPLSKMVIAAVAVIVLGRLVLKPLFRLLISIKSDEVITAFALLLVFATSWATGTMGLSLALGAFLGGLALSESSYAHLVRGEVAPFRSLLLSLFFLSVGINIELGLMFRDWQVLVLLIAAFVVVKIVANWIAFRLVGIERGVATLLSFLLGQGSEFAFVLLAIAASSGLIDSTQLSLSVSVVGLSLAITPAVAAMGCYSSRSVCRVGKDEDVDPDDEREVIIVRIDEYGRQLAGLLEMERIPYRAHDNDLERLAYAKSRGLNVYFSDLNRPRTLGRASMGKALAVVSLVEDDHILAPLIQGLKKIDGSLPIVAATESPGRFERLNSLGVEQAYIKNQDSLIVLYEALLRSMNLDESRIGDAVDRALHQLQPEGLFPQVDIRETFVPQEALAA